MNYECCVTCNCIFPHYDLTLLFCCDFPVNLSVSFPSLSLQRTLQKWAVQNTPPLWVWSN